MPELKNEQGVHLPPECIQQFKIMQARATNADLATMDLRNEVNALIQTLIAQIDKLQKENGDLKARHEKTSNP